MNETSYIEPGTVLKVFCPNKFVWHYGVMSHYGSVIDRAKKGIQLRSWEEFSENLPVTIVAHDKNDFSKEVIHERAMGQIGKHGYHMIFQNCEHFVSWCRKNRFISQQLNLVILAILIIGLLVAIYRSIRKK